MNEDGNKDGTLDADQDDPRSGSPPESGPSKKRTAPAKDSEGTDADPEADASEDGDISMIDVFLEGGDERTRQIMRDYAYLFEKLKDRSRCPLPPELDLEDTVRRVLITGFVTGEDKDAFGHDETV